MTIGAYRTVRANGLDFEVLEAGVGDRLALLLHGFPEHAISWHNQIAPLVALGYRVWAPNQRGYGSTTRPEHVDAYRIARLVDDVAALIDASGARSVVLVGHDWGAAVAWFFAMRAPRPIERLVILNVPHPAVFLGVVSRSWRQMCKSWYLLAFQIPGLAERVLGMDDGRAMMRVLEQSACDPMCFSIDEREAYVRQARDPATLAAMLNWYRAAARGGMAEQIALGFPTIDLPTLVVWGEEDVALGKETTYGTERFASDVRIVYLPGVSHWVAQEAPERVNALLASFLA